MADTPVVAGAKQGPLPPLLLTLTVVTGAAGGLVVRLKN